MKKTIKPILCALDFDDVLFDGQKFNNAHLKAFECYGVSRTLYEETYRETKMVTGGHYTPSTHYALISQRAPSVSAQLLHKKSGVLVGQAHRYLYADAKPFLQWCKKSGITRALVSTGSLFQKQKVSASGLAPFFKKVIVTKAISKVVGLGAAMRVLPNARVVFVDDKSTVLDEIKKELPEVLTIQMRRRGQEVSKYADAEVRNFAGVKKILHALKKER